MFSLDPVTSMGGAARADIQPHVISNLVTKPWCDAMTEAGQRADTNALKSDPVVKRMIEMHHRILRDISKPIFAVDYGAFGKSFILNFVLHGDPYYKVQKFKERTVYGAHGYESLREDVQLETAINAVNRSGTPFLLVHLPTLLEMRAGGQFVHGMTGTPEERERKLAASLEQVTGKKVIHLYDYYDSEVRADPLRLVYSEHDSHPSPTGVKAMAKALEQMLMRIPETSEMFGNARRVQ
mgnify:FL=1